MEKERCNSNDNNNNKSINNHILVNCYSESLVVKQLSLLLYVYFVCGFMILIIRLFDF